MIGFGLPTRYTVSARECGCSVRVLSGPDVPEDVGSVDDEGEIWSVAGTEEEVEVADLGRRPLQAAFLVLDKSKRGEIFKRRV